MESKIVSEQQNRSRNILDGVVMGGAIGAAIMLDTHFNGPVSTFMSNRQKFVAATEPLRQESVQLGNILDATSPEDLATPQAQAILLRGQAINTEIAEIREHTTQSVNQFTFGVEIALVSAAIWSRIRSRRQAH